MVLGLGSVLGGCRGFGGAGGGVGLLDRFTVEDLTDCLDLGPL